MPSSATARGWVPTSEVITDGSPSQGAFLATVANFEENSPKDRCCDRSRMSPKEAMSQKAVVPPLPSTTW